MQRVNVSLVLALGFAVAIVSAVQAQTTPPLGPDVVTSVAAPEQTAEIRSAVFARTLLRAAATPRPSATLFRTARLAPLSRDGAGSEGGVIEDSGPNYRTAIGYRALFSNTSGGSNTASGYQALYSNTTGGRNTATGFQTLYSNVDDTHDNTAMGFQALYSNTTGGMNAAVGSKALYSNVTGYNNTAAGANALLHNLTGFSNVASGFVALYSNTDGHHNAATGGYALYSNTTGNFNTAVGHYSLQLNDTGSYNTAVGAHAGGSHNGNYNIHLGADVSGDDTNVIRIGRPYDDSTQEPPSGQNKTYVAGIVESPLTPDMVPLVLGIATGGSDAGRLGTMAADMLPSKGDPGPQGTPGVGLVPGSILFLVSGATPPAGFELVGTTKMAIDTGAKKPATLVVNIYKMQ